VSPSRNANGQLPPRRVIQNFDARRRGGRREIFERNPRLRGFNTFSPIIFSGSPYLYDSGYYDDSSQYGPPADYSDQPYQQPGDQDIYASYSNGSTRYQAPPYGDAGDSQYPPTAQPATGPSDWVLVRKDGGLIFSSAFTVHGGQISYIDSKDVLRKVMLADLDLDATRKFNEELGLTISIPN
jgi:hypothetical protein